MSEYCQATKLRLAALATDLLNGLIQARFLGEKEEEEYINSVSKSITGMNRKISDNKLRLRFFIAHTRHKALREHKKPKKKTIH